MLTVPSLEVATDWAPVHDRLVNDFPDIIGVLATTMPATLLIAYEGAANVDAWLEVISERIRSRRARAGHRDRRRRERTAGNASRSDVSGGTQSHFLRRASAQLDFMVGATTARSAAHRPGSTALEQLLRRVV
jgi:hypothetical protein